MQILTIWKKDPIGGWNVCKTSPVKVGEKFNLLAELTNTLKDKLDAYDVDMELERDSEVPEMNNYYWLKYEYRTEYQKKNPQVNQAKQTLRVFLSDN